MNVTTDDSISLFRINDSTEAVTQMRSVKKLFLKIPQNSQKNTDLTVSFWIKFQVDATLSKERPCTGVFLSILKKKL